MMNQIMDLLKGQITKTVGGIAGIPAAQQSAVVETTAGALFNGLKQNASMEGLGALLGGGKAASGIAGSLSTGVVGALTSKLGLNSGIAQTIAQKVVPAVTSLLKTNVNDPSKQGFNLESMLGGLTGGGGLGGMLGGLTGGASSSKSGGLMGMLGGLFGKK